LRLSHAIALCATLLAPVVTAAQTIGPNQAETLQRDIRDWLSGLLGRGNRLPDLTMQITGQGDHYRLLWPIPGLDNPAANAALTASVRPLDGGRWSIEEMKLPDSASFTIKPPDTGDITTSGPLKVALSFGPQDSHGLIDPSLATASLLHIDIGNVAATADSATEHQEQRIDRYTVKTSLKPAHGGRLDLAMDATMAGWKSASRTEGGAAVAIAAQNMHAVGRVDGLNRDKISGLVSASNAFIQALPPDVMEKHGKADLPAPARAQLRALIAALPDMLNGVRLEETVEGLQVEMAGIGGLALQRILLGFGGEAPDGKLHAWFDIALDGLDTPTLPPKVAAYLPRHIGLRPSISGVRTADLIKLALDATEEGANDDRLAPDIAAIFAHGGVNLGMEALSFDLGPAKVEGVGKVVMLSPEIWRGEARLSATGLDELATQARTNPDLQQALPVLIMLRGLAKPDGDRLIWNIISEGTAVTVNGIDLSQLGGDKPAGKQPPGQPRRR
jgi:hypothetical protein